MKTVIEMAREAGAIHIHERPKEFAVVGNEAIERFAELVRADAIADEREQIAQMIEDAPPMVKFVTNDHGGCLMCGFTAKLAVAAIRARGEASIKGNT